MRVLLSAYACEPEKGSEPGVGWNWVGQIARFHEVWVLTRANNQDSIKQSLAKRPLPNVHWVYFDLPGWARFWKKNRRGIHLYYFLWQLGAYFRAKKLHRHVGFDLVHHVTLVNYWMPSFLALLPPPFVWGPVGGGESAPQSFWRSLSLRGKVYEAMRELARRVSELNPLLRLPARCAAIGLATTAETAKRLRAVGCRNVSLSSEAGLTADEMLQLSGLPLRENNIFRVISVGNLLHLKGFELGLRAFARFQRQFPTAEYWIIGDGPERKRLERLTRELDLSDKVTFMGALPRREVFGKLAEGNVLLHPTLHDSGGWVCLEAMAAGRPVICLDLGGPAVQVTDDTGIKVPATSPQQAVSDLAAAMMRLAQDPGLRFHLAQAGRERVAGQFDWEQKGNFMANLYATLKKDGIDWTTSA
jgi:glycosyltransferase involved in cell wall biosynthesis